MTDDSLLIKPARKLFARTEICRSYAYKVNAELYGGPRFENRDFFASHRCECAVEDAVEVSAALYQVCKREVLAAASEYIAELRRQAEMRRSA